ncbi:PDZ domain-containing protein [Puteibacter caeruleilacunae]|nr:PDZ domain-containing protein [Puteibacter caeruleilacunae]
MSLLKNNKWSIIILLFSFFIVSCSDDDDPIVEPQPNPELNNVSEDIQKVNNFIWDKMDTYYLWRDKMPTDINRKKEENSIEYFDKLLYTEKDKWSFITDDLEGLQNSFKGVETGFGYSIAFGKFSNKENAYFAIVEYVYPGTPAAEANLKRGDLIVALDGGDINDDNYKKLFDGSTIIITKGKLENNSIANNGDVELTSKVLNLDPVLIDTVFTVDDHKIGYLSYMQYINDYNSSIDEAMAKFESENITDLIVDVRYNPGGSVNAANHLCSSIAPKEEVDKESLFVTFQWNDQIMAEIKGAGQMDDVETPFNKDVPTKLDMDKVYILATGSSASASELTINNLRPYMDVVLIGETTHGKYTASITLTDESKDPVLKNWALQPIVAKYANAAGVSDFADGFTPDFEVKDELLPAMPLGDLTDPLIAKAVEQITGNSDLTALKAAKVHYNFEVKDRLYSKFQKFKETLIIK